MFRLSRLLGTGRERRGNRSSSDRPVDDAGGVHRVSSEPFAASEHASLYRKGHDRRSSRRPLYLHQNVPTLAGSKRHSRPESNHERKVTMKPRIDYAKVAGGVLTAMREVEKYLHGCGIDESLLHLIKLRVSQINGCAYCIDMHWKDLRSLGEGEQRLYGLDAWEESPYYTDRERAALAWAEAVTNLREGHVPDAV